MTIANLYKRPLRVDVPFEIKGIDDGARTFTGLAAAWSLDLGDDRLIKGAFSRSLGRWRTHKDTRPIPLVDAHDSFGSVENVLGKMLEAQETDHGLLATFEMVSDDPRADAAYRRIKGGFITGLSIGYTPKVTEKAVEDGRQIRQLKEVLLHEVSLVAFPMNEDARVVNVKSMLDALTDAEKDVARDLLIGPADESPDAETPTAPEQKATDNPPAAPQSAPPAEPAEKLASPENMARLRATFAYLKYRDLAARRNAPPGPSGQTPDSEDPHDVAVNRSEAEGVPRAAG